jgi:prevent-host-death family protein
VEAAGEQEFRGDATKVWSDKEESRRRQLREDGARLAHAVGPVDQPPQARSGCLTNLVKLSNLGRMAKAVSIGEAKANFSELVRRAEAGEEIFLRRGNHRVARIVPLPEQRQVGGFGAMKDEIRIGEDFDQPLEDFAEYE